MRATYEENWMIPPLDRDTYRSPRVSLHRSVLLRRRSNISNP